MKEGMIARAVQSAPAKSAGKPPPLGDKIERKTSSDLPRESTPAKFAKVLPEDVMSAVFGTGSMRLTRIRYGIPIMNQPPDAKIYSGAIDCVMKITAAEGPQGFYRGFIPIWMRFAPTTCLQLIIFEQLQGAMGMKGI